MYRTIITLWQRMVYATTTFFLLLHTRTITDPDLITNVNARFVLSEEVSIHSNNVFMWPWPLNSHIHEVDAVDTGRNCCWHSNPPQHTHTLLDGFSEDTHRCRTDASVSPLLCKMAVNQAGHRCFSHSLPLGGCCVRVHVCVWGCQCVYTVKLCGLVLLMVTWQVLIV